MLVGQFFGLVASLEAKACSHGWSASRNPWTTIPLLNRPEGAGDSIAPSGRLTTECHCPRVSLRFTRGYNPVPLQGTKPIMSI